tara:strand:- start:1394 stop:2311 length:918 start_codon:yes stop_codon:yes gene_type:complete
MGFNKESLKLCNQISSQLLNADVISLGNPFLYRNQFANINIDTNIIKYLFKLDRNFQARYLFENIYKVQSFSILDISDEERATHLADLNEKIIDKGLYNNFDFLLDLGTQEHVFNNSNFLINVFSILREGGQYIFNLPCNGSIDHGFRQYSPTFFYDLCHANSSSLKLSYLAMHTNNISVNCMPLYSRLDKDFLDIVHNNSQLFTCLSDNYGPATGSVFRLFSRMPVEVRVLGVITKISYLDLHLNPIQCIYRNFDLKDVIIRREKSFNDLLPALKKMFKEIFIITPSPVYLKLILLKIFKRILK